MIPNVAAAMRTELRLVPCAFLRTDCIDADDRKEDSHSCDEHRSKDCLELQVGSAHIEGRSTKRTGCQDGSAVRLIKVSTHSGHVTHIVTHIVCDCSRVARVVFRDTGLHLADEVCTDVSSLCVDTTTHTREKSLCRSTHTKCKHSGCDDHEVLRIGGRIESRKDEPPYGDIEKSETYDCQTHDGTASESDLKT